MQNDLNSLSNESEGTYVSSKFKLTTDSNLCTTYEWLTNYFAFHLVKQKKLTEIIFSDLLGEVVLGLCFQIHRSSKLGLLFLDESEE